MPKIDNLRTLFETNRTLGRNGPTTNIDYRPIECYTYVNAWNGSLRFIQQFFVHIWYFYTGFLGLPFMFLMFN
jgi:hypothetical protein